MLITVFYRTQGLLKTKPFFNASLIFKMYQIGVLSRNALLPPYIICICSCGSKKAFKKFPFRMSHKERHQVTEAYDKSRSLSQGGHVRTVSATQLNSHRWLNICISLALLNKQSLFWSLGHVYRFAAAIKSSRHQKAQEGNHKKKKKIGRWTSTQASL